MKDLLQDTLIKNELVVSICNSSYIFLLKNWINWINLYSNYEPIIFSTDQKTNLECEKLNINYIDLTKFFNKKELKDIWNMKLKIFASLTLYNYNFIFSDLDAVWLKNPSSVFDNITPIQFSQGTIWPNKTFHKNKFVVCTGIFKVISNNYTKSFFNSVLENPEFNKHRVSDQKSINLHIDKNEEWDISDDYYLINFKNTQLTCFNYPIFTKSKNIKLIPHKYILRCTSGESKKNKSLSLIVHPIEAEGTQFNRIVKMKKLNLIHHKVDKNLFLVFFSNFFNLITYYSNNIINFIKYKVKKNVS